MENKGIKLENTYINLPEMFYSKQNPSKVPSPEIIKFNDKLADDLGIDKDFMKSQEGIDILAGNKVLENTVPIAEAYAGHQFGYFTMLGDGRAVLLGEVISKDNKRFDLQLKGSGKTPYSRGGDGKAALGPMLREYIISEGMHSLGIKSTRSLAVLKTGEIVYRDTELDGAILARIAESHIRVATFEFAAKFGREEDVKALADYTIERHFKDKNEINNTNSDYINNLDKDNKYLALLAKVVKRQAELIAKWQLVGFIHGVMNTDNMSICGETIDYGPCAFMDTYDPDTVFSSIDIYGRYAYKNQPKMAVWNLSRFAETLLPLINEENNNDEDMDETVKTVEKVLSAFTILYESEWMSGMRKKLGLFNEEENDKVIINELLDIMKENKADYTNTFYYLTTGYVENLPFVASEKFNNWYALWSERLKRQNETIKDIRELMENNNPAVIPRNHRVEEALSDAQKGNYKTMNSLLEVLKNPYDYSKVNSEYIEVPKNSSCGYKTYCGT
ncbi:MAG TPA: YdiU family protein [Clostridium sp.]|nr:YdiU family protein [Clostridium sp.]